MADYRSSVSISEVDPASGDVSGRTLVLVGPGLPFMGAEWAMRTNLHTTWNPGNGDEATQQVIGPQELPSRWQGDWRRTMLRSSPCELIDGSGNAIKIVAPFDMMTTLEGIWRGGRRLRVTWAVQGDSADQTGRLVREGRIAELKFKPTRIQDIEWEIEFHWVGRGARTAKVTSTRGGTVTGDTSAYLNKLNALIAANITATLQRYNPQTLTLGQLEAIASYPTALVNSLARQVQQIQSSVGTVVSIASTISSQPVQIASRSVDLAYNTVAQTNNFYDTLSRVPFEQMSNKTRLSDQLNAHRTFGAQSDAARDLAGAGTDFANRLAQTVQAGGLTGVIATSRVSDPNSVSTAYVTKPGDTPAFVSQKFFGTPDHAVDILRANRLSWFTPTFPTGKVLIIPALTEATSTVGV